MITNSIVMTEAHAYRIGQLTERLRNLQDRISIAVEEQREILLRYGLTASRPVEVVTEPGAYPIGTVLDGITKKPIKSVTEYSSATESSNSDTIQDRKEP